MVILCVALLSGLLEKTEEKAEDGLLERLGTTAKRRRTTAECRSMTAERRSTASRTLRRSNSEPVKAASPATAKGRKSLDVRKSIWDGGAGGAMGKGNIAGASSRGIAAEEERRSAYSRSLTGGSEAEGEGGEGRGRGISEAALNPGFM